MIGVGRTKLYELIATGDVKAVKLGKATRITTASLYDLVRRQCEAPTPNLPRQGTRPIAP